MAQGERLLSDVLRIMRLAISRRNTNDPTSTDTVLLRYVNDFMSLSMGSDLMIREQYGTLSFNIDDTVEDGVYTFNDVGASSDFMSVGGVGFISLYSATNESINWNPLEICKDPTYFFQRWGINNYEILTAGMPTDVLFYENKFTFRTIPDDEYVVNFYGYKKINDYGNTTDALPFDYWLRYVAYGAALDYVNDYNYSAKQRANVEKEFKKQRKLLLTNTHNNLTSTRGKPSF